jgi:hypothetical protein
MTIRQDRKTKFYKPYINLNGEELSINASDKYGVYKEIIIGFVSQLDIALSIHKRLLVHRIDLHTTYYTPNNKIISRFMNRIKQWLKRNYGLDNIGYIWVREKERAKHQHYHLALLLNGDKIRHPKRLNETLKEKWLPYGHIPVIKSPYYFIDKHNHKEMRGKVIYRVSYLAKVRGKGYRDGQANDYQTSRLKSEK